MLAAPLVSDDFAAFLEAGQSLVVAVRDSELRPHASRAWALQVHPDGRHVSLFLYSKAAASVRKHLESHPEIAVDVDAPNSHRACQIKGRYSGSRRARAAEKGLIERQVAGFIGQLEEIGIPRELTAGWIHWPAMAIEFEITELYEQTPGPGAGEPMK